MCPVFVSVKAVSLSHEIFLVLFTIRYSLTTIHYILYTQHWSFRQLSHIFTPVLSPISPQTRLFVRAFWAIFTKIKNVQKPLDKRAAAWYNNKADLKKGKAQKHLENWTIERSKKEKEPWKEVKALREVVDWKKVVRFYLCIKRKDNDL